MTVAPWGLDYASVDEDHPPDFAALYAAGCRWVTFRAEYVYRHQDLVDAMWRRDHTAAVAAGLRVQPYLFAGYDLGDPTPEIQMTALASSCVGHRRGIDMVPAIDIEFPHGTHATGRSIPGLMDIIRRLVAATRDTFGTWPELYLSGRVWNTTDTDTLGNPPADDLFNCSIWVAHYPFKIHLPAVFNYAGPMPAYPNPWGFAWKHQYQGDAHAIPGLSSQGDLSRFLPLVPGDTGPKTRWVQHRLDAWEKAGGAMGGATTFDGTLRAFQVQHGLVADGIVGLDTHTALSWIAV